MQTDTACLTVLVWSDKYPDYAEKHFVNETNQHPGEQTLICETNSSIHSSRFAPVSFETQWLHEMLEGFCLDANA